jgi:hypothetical protein
MLCTVSDVYPRQLAPRGMIPRTIYVNLTRQIHARDERRLEYTRSAMIYS